MFEYLAKYGEEKPIEAFDENLPLKLKEKLINKYSESLNISGTEESNIHKFKGGQIILFCLWIKIFLASGFL